MTKLQIKKLLKTANIADFDNPDCWVEVNGVKYSLSAVFDRECLYNLEKYGSYEFALIEATIQQIVDFIDGEVL